MKILFVGDVHGRFKALEHFQRESLKQFPDIDCAVQVGDFGFYPDCMDPLGHKIKLPLKTYAIDGNHEDHVWLHQIALGKGFWDKWKHHNNICFVRRGEIKEFGSAKFGFLGGAMSVDRNQHGSFKTNTHNWVEFSEAYSFADKMDKYGGVDVLVTHSCPCHIGILLKGDPFFTPELRKRIYKPFRIPHISIEDVGEHALKMMYKMMKRKPPLWIFGHFHIPHEKEIDGIRFLALDKIHLMEDDKWNSVMPFVYDTEVKDFVVGDRIIKL